MEQNDNLTNPNAYQELTKIVTEALIDAKETINWMWQHMKEPDGQTLLRVDEFNRPANALHIIDLALTNLNTPTKLTQERADLIREVNGRDLDGVSDMPGETKAERYDELYRLTFSNLAKLRARTQNDQRMVNQGDIIRKIIDEVMVGMQSFPRPEPINDPMQLHQSKAKPGEGKDSVLKVGLKFRSKMAPLNSYEVVKIFPETKEFKVKDTRECQVSGTTCYEVWSIEGFEKYYGLGVYYIDNKKG